MTEINPKIFKAYDIRGVYPSELNESVAERIGKAIVAFAKPKTVVVGRDVRLSSDGLFAALAKGITEQGADILDVGICSTPQLYFAASELKSDLGIMITASHNPKEYNGFKICKEGSVPLSGPTGIFAIRDLALKNRFSEAKTKGKVSKKEIQREYEQFFKSKLKKFKTKVVIDAANSVGALEAKLVAKCCDSVALYWELDGNFPNHLGNPLEYETLHDLQAKVREVKAEIGMAFDGDADRIAFVDEKGQIVANDVVTALLTRFFSKETILFDVRSTKQVEIEVKKAQGTPVRCRVGHAFIKQQMRQLDSAFAGELSGHYYYKETFFAESSLQTALLMLRLLEKEKKPLSRLVKEHMPFFQSGEINSTVENAQETMNEIEKRYEKIAKRKDRLDGLTLEFDSWWFNLRASNTEPLLRLNVEAETENELEEKKKELLALIRK